MTQVLIAGLIGLAVALVVTVAVVLGCAALVAGRPAPTAGERVPRGSLARSPYRVGRWAFTQHLATGCPACQYVLAYPDDSRGRLCPEGRRALVTDMQETA